MNLKNLFAKLSLLVVFLMAFTVSTFAQANYWVSATNGTALSPGTQAQPFKTITQAITAAAAGDNIYVYADTYNEGVGPTQLNINKVVNLFALSFNGLDVVGIPGGILVNPGADKTVGLGNGSSVKFNVGTTAGALNLMSGSLNITTANLVLGAGATITRSGGSISAAPTFGTTTNLVYTGGTITSGPELPASVLSITLTAGTLTLGQNVTLTGDINNAGTIKLGNTTLTWAPAANVAVTAVGTIVSATAGTVGQGTISLSGSKNITLNAAAGTIPNLTVPAGYTGTFQLNNTLTVDGTFSLASATVGVVNLNNQTMNVRGDFLRTNNTVGNFGTGTGVLNFVGGEAQTFNPGASLVLYDLTITKTANTTVSATASVEVTRNVTITTGNLNVSDFNINMTGAGGTFTNTGNFYSSTSNGYLVFNGTAGQTITGAGSFGNIQVNMNGAAALTVTATSTIKFAGILVLNNGILALAGNNFTITGASKIRRNTNTGQMTTGGGTFSTNAGVTYDLEYFGTASVATAGEWLVGTLAAPSINNLDVVTTTGQVVTGPAAASFMAGRLKVNATETLTLGNTLTLAGASQASLIPGTVNGNTIIVTGNANSITGSTVATDPASILNLEVKVGAGNTFTSTDIKTITGTLTNTSGTSTITMNATNANITGAVTVVEGDMTLTVAGSATSTMTGAVVMNTAGKTGSLTLTRGGASTTVTGPFTVAIGYTLNLGSNVTNSGATTLGGTLNLNAKNFTTVGAFTQNTGATDGAVTGTGYLVLAHTANQAFTVGGTSFTVPNLEINNGAVGNTVTITTNGFTVNGAFKHTKGTLDFNALTLTLAGTPYTIAAFPGTANYTATGGGTLTFTGTTTATYASNTTYPNAVTLNTDGGVTIAEKTAGTAIAVTISGAFTQTKGNIATGINDLTITPGAFTRTAGNWSQGTGYLNLGVAAPTFGTGFSIDNLKLTVGTTPAGTAAFTVGKNLIMGGSLTTGADNRLVLGTGATIERQGNLIVLDKVPQFGSSVNLSYTTAGAITMAKEVPATDIINNVNVAVGVTMNNSQVITVNGTLTLAALLDAKTTPAPDAEVKMAANSTLVLKANGNVVLDQDLTRLGILNIVYDGAIATSTRELLALNTGGTAYATPTSGLITFKSGTVVLQKILTVEGGLKFDGGKFDLGGQALNVNSDVTAANTTDLINSGAATAINFTGSNNTTFNLTADWDVNSGVATGIDLVINKTNATNTVALTGGNLNFATNHKSMTLTKGIWVTGSKIVILDHQVNAVTIQPNQGYTRTSGYVQGNVRKYLDIRDEINNGVGVATPYNDGQVRLTRVEFPVGEANNYRPMAFQFNTLPTANLNLTVNHIASSPGGEAGFNILDNTLTSTSKELANYPGFYWLVSSDLTLQPQVKYDIEAEAYGYAPTNYPEGIGNVRFLRRFANDINNPWLLQGGLNYDNSTNVDHPKIIVRNAEGAISTQGALFTYSQVAKAPTVATALAAVPATENVPLTIVWTKTKNNLGTVPVTFDAAPVWTATAPAVVPTNATFDAATGTLTWTPTFTQSGVYTVKVTARESATLVTENTVTITVANANQQPSFTATGAAVLADATIPYGTAKEFPYVAKDSDNEPLTYGVTIAQVPGGTAPAGAYSISNAFGSVGLFTFTPTFADNGKVFVVTVTATDTATPVAGVATTTATLTIGAAYKRGDATINGVIDVDDAIAVLKYKAGVVDATNPLTDPAKAAEAKVYANAFGFDGVSTDVTTYDAAFILRYLDSGTSEATRTWPVSKVVATTGTVEFGKLSNVEGKMVLPFTLANTTGVNSIFAEADLGSSNVDVKAIQSRLPQDWYVVTSIENGKVRIAAAGTSALKEGTFASIELTLSNKEAVVSVNGNALLNDDVNASLNAKVREIPSEFALSQNYPNPFNPTTSIKFSVAQDAKVNLVVYDMLGQRVRTLVDGIQEAGFYTVRWDGSNDFGSKVASGIYIYRLQAGSFVSTMKMNLMK